jgi:hypothetical protein
VATSGDFSGHQPGHQLAITGDFLVATDSTAPWISGRRRTWVLRWIGWSIRTRRIYDEEMSLAASSTSTGSCRELAGWIIGTHTFGHSTQVGWHGRHRRQRQRLDFRRCEARSAQAQSGPQVVTMAMSSDATQKRRGRPGPAGALS